MSASLRKKTSAKPAAVEPMLRVEPSFEQRWPGSSAMATECMMNLGQFISAFLTRVAALGEPYDIPSANGFIMLMILSQAGRPIAPSMIAERMTLTRGAVSQMLQTLERRDMVRRVRDAGDGRSLLAELTPNGRARIDAFRPVLHRWEAELLSALSSTQQQELLRTVAVLQSHMRQPSE
jgi:DNA-binding MarR family transcriptional regulator